MGKGKRKYTRKLVPKETIENSDQNDSQVELGNVENNPSQEATAEREESAQSSEQPPLKRPRMRKNQNYNRNVDDSQPSANNNAVVVPPDGQQNEALVCMPKSLI